MFDDLAECFKAKNPTPSVKLPDVVSIRIQKAKDWKKKKRAWRRKYRAYLLTDGWSKRRAKRLKKCGGICEYCKKAPAQHVHHVTYKRVFKEWTRDLRGICIECHEKLHGKKFRKRRKKPKPENVGTHEVKF